MHYNPWPTVACSHICKLCNILQHPRLLGILLTVIFTCAANKPVTVSAFGQKRLDIPVSYSQ